MTQPNITVVINGHREGLIAAPTIASAQRSAAFARDRGVSVEVMAVLDRPDELTIEVFRSGGIEPMFVDHGDPGMSRNSAVKLAQGQWIAFLDGDDLFGTSWLQEAYASSQSDQRNIIWHPEINLYFGGYPHIFHHMDMESKEFHLATIAVSNYWTALCFAPRELLLSCPYPTSNMKHQRGFEDWAWNMETIHRGWIHKVVPGTAHAIRIKTSTASVNRTATNNRCLWPRTELFLDIVQQRPLQQTHRDVKYTAFDDLPA
ncbi:MAG: glycosyltransferase family 2 protein [Bacteroidales bacterium]|nr:glycosyltransferase family 2 protein [Bacteroidales bacterium]